MHNVTGQLALRRQSNAAKGPEGTSGLLALARALDQAAMHQLVAGLDDMLGEYR